MKAIMYHYVREYNREFPNFRFLDVHNFRKQLEFLEKEYGFVTYDEWCQYINEGILPSSRGKVLLTFDDALSCHYRYVFPELKARGLWGIFYVPTSPYTEKKIIDDHKVHLLCGALEGKDLLQYASTIVSEQMIAVPNREEIKANTYTNQINYEGVTEFKRLLNFYVDYEYRSEIIDAIGRHFGVTFDVSGFYVTAKQIAEMASSKMLFGAHTNSHPIMSRLSARQQAVEIQSSFDYLASVCDLPLRTYCHPHGGFHSFNDDTIRLLNDYDVVFSFNVESREINGRDREESAQFLPRFDCNEFPFGAAS